MGKQFVRAVDSISANIAEAYRRYHYKDRQVEMINTYIEQIGPKPNSLINSFKNSLPHK